MAQVTGRNGAVKLGSNSIANLANWSIDFGLETAGERVFADNGWTPVAGVLGQTWTATVDGYLDETDSGVGASRGQNWLIDTAFSGTKLTDMKFYEDADTFWEADTATQADAGCYISGLTIGVPRNGISTINFTVAGHGPIKRTVA